MVPGAMKKFAIHGKIKLMHINKRTLTGVWKKRIPILMGYFEGFEASVEEVMQMWYREQEN